VSRFMCIYGFRFINLDFSRHLFTLRSKRPLDEVVSRLREASLLQRLSPRNCLKGAILKDLHRLIAPNRLQPFQGLGLDNQDGSAATLACQISCQNLAEWPEKVYEVSFIAHGVLRLGLFAFSEAYRDPSS